MDSYSGSHSGCDWNRIFLSDAQENLFFGSTAGRNPGNVVISTDTTKEEITDREKIKDLIYVLEGNGRTTRRESINDFPVNAETPIKIEFCFARAAAPFCMHMHRRIDII